MQYNCIQQPTVQQPTVVHYISAPDPFFFLKYPYMYAHVHKQHIHMHLRAIYVLHHHHFYTHIAFCAQNTDTCSKGTRTVMRTSMCKAYCTFSFPSSFHLLFAGLDQLIGSCKNIPVHMVHVILLHVHHNTSTCITTTCTSQHKYMYYYYMYITTQVHVLLAGTYNAHRIVHHKVYIQLITRTLRNRARALKS